MKNSTDLYLFVGYLGTGKTTTLVHVLSSQADLTGTLAIVNEVGRLGLDGQIVEKTGVEVKQLNNGCICCSLKVELVDLLRKLLADNKPERILIEASGLADPGAVINTIRRFVSELGFIKTTVVIEPEIWEIREVLGDAFQASIKMADLLVINKTEELCESEMEMMRYEIKKLRSDLEMVFTTYGQVDVEQFFKAPSLPNQTESEGELTNKRPEALAGYSTVCFDRFEAIDKLSWEIFLAQWGSKLERIKGQILLDDQLYYFDWVRGKGDYNAPQPDLKSTQLVLIGKGFDEAKLKGDLNQLGVYR
ncbi:MAG: GTP-binding protein [Deltaproteobacteria bacterium]|nr:GTP-binding protein [Deltaproteobacteria bacterium]